MSLGRVCLLLQLVSDTPPAKLPFKRKVSDKVLNQSEKEYGNGNLPLLRAAKLHSSAKVSNELLVLLKLENLTVMPLNSLDSRR